MITLTREDVLRHLPPNYLVAIAETEERSLESLPLYKELEMRLSPS